jgi:hypothetical protein
LTHAARQLARIGVFEAVQTDQVDGRQRTFAPLASAHALGFETGFHILQNGQPWEQREGLKHHRHPLGRAIERLAEVVHRAVGRLDQAGNDAKQRRLARARTAQHADDLAFAQRQVHIVENQQFVLVLGEATTYVLHAQHFFPEAWSRRRRLGRRLEQVCRYHFRI